MPAAVASVIAEKGYGAMSTDDVAAAAAISLSTFYEHFTDKRDAVLGALEMSGAQITALAVPAARRAGGWQQGVRALYEAICHYFAAEPAMAELALVGVYGAGEEALARRDRVIESLAAMLAPGFAENPDGPAVSAEGDRGDGLRADARAGPRDGRAREPRRGGPARDLRDAGRLHRPRARPGRRQRERSAKRNDVEVGRRRDAELLLGGLGAEVGEDRGVHQFGDLLLAEVEFAFRHRLLDAGEDDSADPDRGCEAR